MERNVAVIVLDAVRKDVFDEIAFRLQEVADVEYSSCRSASSWSVPSHASMFTGQLPSEHGVHRHSPSYQSVDDNRFITDRLDSHRSISITSNHWTSVEFEWDKYFDKHEFIYQNKLFPEGCEIDSSAFLYLDYLKRALSDDQPVKSLLNGVGYQLLQKMDDRNYPRLVDYGAKRIARRSLAHVHEGSEPWFLFNNIFDAHQPLRRLPQFDDDYHSADWSFDGGRLDPQELLSEHHPQELDDIAGDISTVRDLYAAAIEYLDRVVSEYVERLCRAGPGETTVIITADHGENLAYDTERNHLYHKGSMTDALLHVPLIVVNPPASAPSGRIDGLVSHLDLPELVEAIARDDWHELERTRVPAERISSIVDTDECPWIEPELDWWSRSIRRVYRGERSVEWDTEGNIFEWRHSHEAPSAERLVGRLDSVPDAVADCFDTRLYVYRDDVTDQETIEVSDHVAQNLKQIGYL